MPPIARLPQQLTPADHQAAECERVRARLIDFVDGEAAADVADDVLSHVTHCTKCRHAADAMRRVIEAVQRSQLPVLASRRLVLRVQQMFADQEKQVAESEGDSPQIERVDAN